MKKIRSSKKGFTLAELLIVVAIIGVLVGISIPIFTAQLEKSREATDIANLRAAKAAMTAVYLDGDYDSSKDYFYDAEKGALVNTAPTKGYGEGTAVVGSSNNTQMGYVPGTSVEGKSIQCSVTETKNSAGEVTDVAITVAFA